MSKSKTNKSKTNTQSSLAKWVMELVDLDPSKLDNEKFQPRSSLDENALQQLMESMRETGGNLEPVLVRRDGEKLEVVAGHHRVEAAKRLGIQVLASVQELDEKEAWQIALISNLVRKDMDPLDEARALQKLNEELGLSHAEIAKRIGKDRSYVSRRIKLLSLPEEVLQLLREPAETGMVLSISHLVELLSDDLTDGDRKNLARRASSFRWSSKNLRTAVTDAIQDRKKKTAKAVAFLKIKELSEKREREEEEKIEAKTALELVDKELKSELGDQYEELSEWEKEAAKKDVVKKLVNRGLVEEDKELGLVKEEKPPQPKAKVEIPDKLTWTIEALEFRAEPRPHVFLRRSILEDIPEARKELTEDLHIFLGETPKNDELLKKLIVAKVLEEFPESQTIWIDYDHYHVFLEFPEKEREKLDELVGQVIREVREYGDFLTPVDGWYSKVTWAVLKGDEVFLYVHKHKWPKPVLRAKLKINPESEFFQVSDLEAMGYTIHAVTFTPSESDDPVEVDISFPDGSRNLLYFESVDVFLSYLKHDLDVGTLPEDVFKMLNKVMEEEKRYRESLATKEDDS